MTILVAVVGDTHADEHSRFEEHNRIMEWIGNDAARRGVDLFAHSGDVFERRSTAKERAAVGGYFRQWASHAPVVVVRGNHDEELDIEWLGKLRSDFRIYAMTRPGIVEVDDEKGVGPLLHVACLPWPEESRLLAALPDASVEEAGDAARAALRTILAGLGEELKALGSPPALFLSHAMVRGSLTSVGQPLIGAPMETGLDDLATVGASAYALGHIHMPQQWDINGAPCHYPGSPRRTSFGETEAKGYLIYEFQDDGNVSVEFVPTPCAPMLLVESTYDTTHDGNPFGPSCLSKHDVFGAEIRFRYRVEAPVRAEAKAEAKMRATAWENYGAINVKLEEVVIATSKARAPEVAEAKTLSGKLEAMWTARGFDPGERRAALLKKISKLEESANAA